jgi:hypothetical protein
MSMPIPTAEASLYKTSGHYFMTNGSQHAARAVLPQQIGPCDPGCLSDCIDGCYDLPPQARIACIRACRRECCPPPPTCGPCEGTRTCTRYNGTTFTQACSC